MNHLSVADRLRILRSRVKKSQQQLALSTGVPQETISRIERGDTVNPSVLVVMKIAKFFGITIDRFVEGELPSEVEIHEQMRLDGDASSAARKPASAFSMSEIAPNLRHLRQVANLRQSELAQHAGVSQAIISRIENGYQPSAKTIVGIANALVDSGAFRRHGDCIVLCSNDESGSREISGMRSEMKSMAAEAAIFDYCNEIECSDESREAAILAVRALCSLPLDLQEEEWRHVGRQFLDKAILLEKKKLPLDASSIACAALSDSDRYCEGEIHYGLSV